MLLIVLGCCKVSCCVNVCLQSVVVRPRDILGEKTDDDDGSRTSADLSESNSSCVDNVFDMCISCAKEACEKRELAAVGH